MTKSMYHPASAPSDSSRPMRAIHSTSKLAIFALFAALLISSGCNLNANGSGGNGSTPPPPPPPPPQTPTAPNELPIVVGAGTGSSPSVNRPLASVTICVPGGSTCQTINNVLVDTGSTGLRLFSSVVSIPVPLEQLSTTNTFYECQSFDTGYGWGPLATADVKLSGEVAANATIQLMGDTTYTPPASCASSQNALSSPQTAGFNGILGVAGQTDCGNACFSGPIFYYYQCLTQGQNNFCQNTILPVAQLVQNPVALFPTDNNGVVFDIPGIPASGAVNVQGSLYFGIGTESNNQLAGATTYQFPLTAYLTTGAYGAFFDSGTADIGLLNNGVFGFPTCGVVYCPASPTAFSVEIAGANGEATILDVVAADITSELNQGMTADSMYVGPSYGGNNVTLGFSFFYGRRILYTWGTGTLGQNAFIAF
jgi:hypothetical protein